MHSLVFRIGYQSLLVKLGILGAAFFFFLVLLALADMQGKYDEMATYVGLVFIIITLWLGFSSFVDGAYDIGIERAKSAKKNIYQLGHKAGIRDHKSVEDKKSKKWSRVKSFIGIGDETTKNFRIRSKNWRISIYPSDESELTLFIFSHGQKVEKKGPDGEKEEREHAAHVYFHNLSSVASVYPKLKPGIYFLELQTPSNSWDISIEEER